MRRASAINLVLLGGGLTLFGAAGVLNEHNRLAACEARRGLRPPGEADDCKRDWQTAYGGGSGRRLSSFGHGSGYSEDTGRFSVFRGIVRGGFGGFGAMHGGGS